MLWLTRVIVVWLVVAVVVIVVVVVVVVMTTLCLRMHIYYSDDLRIVSSLACLKSLLSLEDSTPAPIRRLLK